jgi:hypothetical protein
MFSTAGAFSRRPTKLAVIVFATVAFTCLLLRLYSPFSYKLYHDPTRLHVAVFATSGNYHLCQLHLSAALMGYPALTYLNWQDKEDKDEMKQHLAKLEGAITYLDSLPDYQQDDLVFMLDGFDIWFQLPQEYILKRYHDVVAESHARHVALFGEEMVAKYNIRNTVLFGPDKSCAPAGGDHVSCWAIPESWMPAFSFGPDTDHGRATHNRARWLNSGTIMGPARELRDVFQRALEQEAHSHVTDSDQFYFSHVYGLQSYARRVLKMEYDRSRGCDVAAAEEFLHPKHIEPGKKSIPDLKKEARTEYFIGLDWSSDIFQTTGFYADYIAWIRHNESTPYITDQAQKKGNYHHHFSLPHDLVGKGPLTTQQAVAVDPEGGLDSWHNLPLATNTASRSVPPVMHINGKKGYRHLWWPRNWFFPHIEKMLTTFRAAGVRDAGSERDSLAGAWTFLRGDTQWSAWDDLCGAHEERLMGKNVTFD